MPSPILIARGLYHGVRTFARNPTVQRNAARLGKYYLGNKLQDASVKYITKRYNNRNRSTINFRSSKKRKRKKYSSRRRYKK